MILTSSHWQYMWPTLTIDRCVMARFSRQAFMQNKTQQLTFKVDMSDRAITQNVSCVLG